jgi:hypothetical protein
VARLNGGSSAREHLKRLENREVQEINRRQSRPEAPPLVATVPGMRPGTRRSNVTISSTLKHLAEQTATFGSAWGSQARRAIPAAVGATMQNINLYHFNG